MPDLQPLPSDYLERVYAGVLGKIVGVYLGRPFEGWTYERISAELGEITSYVHDRFDSPLVVTDDDITGTFTFLRALEDRGFDPHLVPAQIGESWLNYLIENRTILWWGGLGTSTEHTAYLRLKSGIRAPVSGSIATNGKIAAEQIGAQIFIDGWAMLFPGDPERAADFARRAASVSHDGEAIYGAQVIAAIEAQAFVENDLNVLLDTAVSLIPRHSTITRVIQDVREWHSQEDDWRKTRAKIAQHYGYDKFPGVCHLVPNHALIIHALLHGNDDFQRTLMIVNTCGWDTDCNSGNVGAIMGLKNGLAGIDSSPVDWRGPIADRLYLPCAEGGRAISDAASVAVRIANAGEALHGTGPTRPKNDARFHFELPGSVQGFQTRDDKLAISNESGQLRLTLRNDSKGAVAATNTFIPTEAINMGGYRLIASPTLYPTQDVSFSIMAARSNGTTVEVRPMISYYGENDDVQEHLGGSRSLSAGETVDSSWTVPDLGGAPVVEFGFAISGAEGDAIFVDHITWAGAPTLSLGRPAYPNSMWRRAWVDGVDHWAGHWPEDFRLSQNDGTGLISQGDETWTDYEVTATLQVPLAKEAGIAARVGGLRRFYALVVTAEGTAQLVKECDGRFVLDEQVLPAQGYDHTLTLRVHGQTIVGLVDDAVVGQATDDNLVGGAVGLLLTEGTLCSGPVTVRSLDRS